MVFTDQIKRLEQVYSALLDFRPGAPPLSLDWGQSEAGGELIPVPPIDNRVGAKDEPVSPPPAIGRVRGAIGLGSGWVLDLMVLPPLDVDGYVAGQSGIAIEYGAAIGALSASLRAFYTQGVVRGPITAPGVLDAFTLENNGGDGRVAWTVGALSVYAGLGAGWSRTRLEIASDGSLSAAAFPYSYGFAGAAWRSGLWRVTVEQQQTESYLSHIVLTASHGF